MKIKNVNEVFKCIHCNVHTFIFPCQVPEVSGRKNKKEGDYQLWSDKSISDEEKFISSRLRELICHSVNWRIFWTGRISSEMKYIWNIGFSWIILSELSIELTPSMTTIRWTNKLNYMMDEHFQTKIFQTTPLSIVHQSVWRRTVCWIYNLKRKY